MASVHKNSFNQQKMWLNASEHQTRCAVAPQETHWCQPVLIYVCSQKDSDFCAYLIAPRQFYRQCGWAPSMRRRNVLSFHKKTIGVNRWS